MSHTPEPWRYVDRFIFAGDREDAVATCWLGGPHEAYVNAERICACVNACRGIKDPERIVPEIVGQLIADANGEQP